MITATPSRQTEIALATHGSPLRKPGVGLALAVALVVFTCFFTWQLTALFHDPAPGMIRVLLIALVVTGAISLIPIAFLRWIDRREPEPWFMYGLALLWGGLIASGIALEINTAASSASGFLGTALVAPIVEETAKGLGLIVLLVALRSEFDGPRDGFIYGALIGLGFNWLESSVYIAGGFTESGAAPWGFQLATRFALLGFSGHALYTGITGTFVGFSLIQRGTLRRIVLPLAGLALAILSHMLWNTLGAALAAITASLLGGAVLASDAIAAVSANPLSIPFWLAWPANAAAVLVANCIGLLAVGLGLRRSGRWEHDVMIEQLKPEVGATIVTPAEYANIKGRGEPPRDPAARRIFQAQCNLAKRKFYLLQHGLPLDDPIVAAWRREARQP